MRVAKKHDIRLNEIIDAAELLFAQKGYDKTTVNDILNKVDIGKGTFYHYFKSKEEVMNAVIGRMADFIAERAKAISEDKTIETQEKMKRIIASLNISSSPNGAIVEELHRPSNAQMHQRSIVLTIQLIAPMIADVVKQGVSEGIYHVEYPRETVEFLLVANQFIFDEGVIKWQPEEQITRVIAFVRLIERALGADEGSFNFIIEAGSQGEK